MAQSIKISDENYKNICLLAKEERRARKTVIDKALENYFRAKKIIPLVCMTKKD